MKNLSSVIAHVGKLEKENKILKEEKVSLEIIISDLQEEIADMKSAFNETGR